MTISELTLEPREAEPVRWYEVFTGSGQRRGWSAAGKARIVAESCEAGTAVSEVARRYASSPQQLFAWSRAARGAMTKAAERAPSFVRAVLAASAPDPVVHRPKQRQKAGRAARVIELEIDGVTMRTGRGADAKTVATVIRARKATV